MSADRSDRDGPDNPFITESNFSIGQLLLNRFELIRLLGSGGFGEVWLASDRQLKVERALKIPGQKIRFKQRAAQTLEKEAFLTARLDHPNIVKLHDFQWTPDGFPLLIFSYIPGYRLDGELLGSLDDWLLHYQKMSELEVHRFLPPILDALQYAHTFQDKEIEHGLIHLDIKPSNILLDRDGQPKVIDFNIASVIHSTTARLSGTSANHGTWPYMAPEQFLAQRTDPRTDIYSLGILLYELLTGNPPFLDGDFAYHHTNNPVPLIEEVSQAMNDLIQKAVAKDPSITYH